jgi:hypothetical protein
MLLDALVFEFSSSDKSVVSCSGLGEEAEAAGIDLFFKSIPK